MTELLSWGLVLGLISLGFTVVLAAHSREEPRIAKGCFLLAAITVGVKIFMWGIETTQGGTIRVLVCFVVFGVTGVLAVESLRYVDRKRDVKLSKETSPVPTTNTSPASLPSPLSAPTPEQSPKVAKSTPDDKKGEVTPSKSTRRTNTPPPQRSRRRTTPPNDTEDILLGRKKGPDTK